MEEQCNKSHVATFSLPLKKKINKYIYIKERKKENFLMIWIVY